MGRSVVSKEDARARRERLLQLCASAGVELPEFEAWLAKVPTSAVSQTRTGNRDLKSEFTLRLSTVEAAAFPGQPAPSERALLHELFKARVDALNWRWQYQLLEEFLLSPARMGRKTSVSNKDNARKPRKVDDATKVRIQKAYAGRVGNGLKYGAIKALEQAFPEISRTTLSRIVNEKK